jgi:LysR family transcriptional regulator, glycine cleavage system transcriptional activator
MQDDGASSGRTPQSDRLPSLKAVHYFASAARLQSFTAAGGELHVTQAAVSRMIQSLEQDLGVQLFDRRGRWISLTVAGKTYHKKVSEGLALIASASSQLRQGRDSGTLTLVVNRGFATLWLVRHLSDFQRQHPQMQITLLDEEAGVQARDDPAGVMIRFGSPPWPGEVATRLPVGPVIGVVCAPGLLAGKPMRHPKDLARLPILAYAGGRYDRWGEFFRHFGLPPPDLERSTRFFQLLALREAALSGLGVALVPLFLFEEELAGGRLVKAIAQTMESKDGYYVIHAKGADSEDKVRSFKRWLLARTRTHAWREPQPG